MPPPSARHAQGTEKKVLHRPANKDGEVDPITGMFQEMDKAISFVDNMTKRTKQRFKLGTHGPAERDLPESTSGTNVISTAQEYFKPTSTDNIYSGLFKNSIYIIYSGLFKNSMVSSTSTSSTLASSTTPDASVLQLLQVLQSST